MNQMIREDDFEDMVLDLFQKEHISTIVLTGKAGIGKTWMARKVTSMALREKIFHLSLFVPMSIKQTERALYYSIASQLSISSTPRELEIDGDEELLDSVFEEMDLEALKKKILSRLSQDGHLLILDDEGKRTSMEDVVIRGLLRFLSGSSLKVLITSLNKDDTHKTDGGKIVMDVKPLSPEKSLSLLQEKAGFKTFETSGARNLAEDFVNHNTGLTPAEVCIVAKLLSYHQYDSTVHGLKCLLENLSDFNDLPAILLTSNRYKKVAGGILVDFHWMDIQFFRDHGAIHYSDLIAYWIMEGYLGIVNCINDAYEKGHQILMELMDLQVLKEIDADYLVVETQTLDLKDNYHSGIGTTASLGLTNVFAKSYDWHGIRGVVHADGAIKTPSIQRKAAKHLTLLLDGNCLDREDQEIFLESDEELQILGLFSARVKCLAKSLSGMIILSVLVLRGCDFLEQVHCIKELRMLTSLEISDARLLTRLPDDLFTHLTKLESLNLSGLLIEVLPVSTYHLTELQWLILKGCSNIKRLSFRRWKKLLVLDLSDAVSFKNFTETTFRSLPKLQFLDLSNTKISFLPFLSDNAELMHLSVIGCQNMSRLPSVKSLSKLQVLDLSGAGIKELQDRSFEKNVQLKILDLSGTAISCLPSDLSACKIYLKGCSQVEKVNCLKSPEILEVLDLSGVSSLADIDAKFFEQTKSLRILNLSRTKIKVLPPLSSAHRLQKLLLSSCLDLVKLPALNSLSKLEVIDLSGCKALTMLEDETFERLSRLERLDISGTNIQRIPELSSLSNLKELNLCGLSSLRIADFLEHMSELQILDLSDTLLENVPPMSCFKSLTHLCLRNCRHLENLPPLEKFTRLEVLDLCGTSLQQLPSLKGLSNLHKLLLKDCFNLKELADIEILDLTGVMIRDLPYGISDLTQLVQLALPNMHNIQESESKRKERSMEIMDENQWAISSLDGAVSQSKRTLMSLSAAEFAKLLRRNHSLQDTGLKNFHFFVHPIQLQSGIGGFYLHKDEYIFREIYLHSRHYPSSVDQFNLLEIHGFHSFPKGIESILSHAKHILLQDNTFIKSLADLGAENLGMMRGCWIDRCQNMKSLVHEDNAEVFAELGKNLEMLWISAAFTLKSLNSSKPQPDCFQNLKYLHLDCCPCLLVIFSESHFLQNLEILDVKFCDNLESVFGSNTKKQLLPSLQKLRLWELPELKTIGCLLPSLQVLDVGRCPRLDYLLRPGCLLESLEVVKVQHCDNLRSLVEDSVQKNYNLPSLNTIELRGLPKLTNIGFDSPHLLHFCIKECPKLQFPVQ